MFLNSKLSKVVSYIHDNKSWERIYIILKLPSPFPWVLCLDDSKKRVTENVYDYSIMTRISIHKSSSNLYNK